MGRLTGTIDRWVIQTTATTTYPSELTETDALECRVARSTMASRVARWSSPSAVGSQSQSSTVTAYDAAGRVVQSRRQRLGERDAYDAQAGPWAGLIPGTTLRGWQLPVGVQH